MNDFDMQNSYKQKQGIKRIPAITDQVLYVNQDKNTDDCEGLKLSTTSWASQIEDEIGSSINDEPLTGSNNVSSWKDLHTKNTELSIEKKNIDIDQIIYKEIENQDDVDLLNNQTIVINSLRKTIKNYVEKYLQNKDQPAFDFTKCISKLEWLLLVSKYFSDKLKVTIIFKKPL